MKDFKSYTPPEGENTQKNTNSKVDTNSKMGTNSTMDGSSNMNVNSTIELAKVLSKEMNGKSEGQLLARIIAEAERNKRAGKLTNADLDNFYCTLSPILDGVKRKKLKEVVERLKRI
jgi:hypothetical protein